MSLHASPLGHILGEQQGLLHCVGDIASCSSLEITDGGIGKERFPIQHWSEKPSQRPHLGVASLFGLRLPCFGLFGCSLNLILSGGKGLPSFNHLFPLFALSSFSSRPVGEGAEQVEEWEAWNELSSQVHLSQVVSLSTPANWTSVCAECPFRRFLVIIMD